MVEEPQNAEKFREDLLRWSEDNLRDFPWRENTDPYQVLIAEVLLKQTNAERVELVYEDLIEEFPAPDDILEENSESLIEILRPLGLYNQRATALETIAEHISDSGIPETEGQLLEIPYVGPYTANSVLCFSMGKARPVVDVNVVRVYSRVFGIPDWGRKSDEIWKFADVMLPDEMVERYNLALIDFGAEVCTSKSPDCESCFANDYCEYYQGRT